MICFSVDTLGQNNPFLVLKNINFNEDRRLTFDVTSQLPGFVAQKLY
jgi:hypothetical protein